MVRILGLILSCVFLASCAYNYDLREPAAAAGEQTQSTGTKIYFDNVIKMSSIDDKPFKPKFSIWLGGSHEVTLEPGIHVFKFKYNAVGGYGGFYTVDDTVLAKSLEAGKEYELQYSVKDSRIRFRVAEKGTPNKW